MTAPENRWRPHAITCCDNALLWKPVQRTNSEATSELSNEPGNYKGKTTAAFTRVETGTAKSTHIAAVRMTLLVLYAASLKRSKSRLKLSSKLSSKLLRQYGALDRERVDALDGYKLGNERCRFYSEFHYVNVT